MITYDPEDIEERAKQLYVKDSGVLEDWELVDETVRTEYRIMAYQSLAYDPKE